MELTGSAQEKATTKTKRRTVLPFIRQIGAALGVSASGVALPRSSLVTGHLSLLSAATVGGFPLGRLLVIAVSAGSSIATRPTNRGYTFSNV